MIRIAILIGSTRPGRKAEDVARWVLARASRRSDAVFDLIDLAAWQLPLLDEAVPPSMQQYSQPHTKAWSETISQYDGFVIVTPEYNHGVPAALKNALDYLYVEWNDKAAGFVSYGSAGGVRAVEQLRQVMGELKVADVRAQVKLTLHDDFIDYTTFNPGDWHLDDLDDMLDQVVAWSRALKTIRTGT